MNELRCIEPVLDRLDRPLPGVLDLVGEPGIGKTRLLKEIGLRAEQHARLVLTGSASELELNLPFWVFVDAVDKYVSRLHPGRLAALEDNVQTDLAHVSLSVWPQPTVPDAPLESEPYRSHSAATALLEHLTETKRRVLVLANVHWADVASVELLSAMPCRLSACAVLLGVARGPRDFSNPLSVALARAHRAAALFCRCKLGPVPSTEAQELLPGRVAGDAELGVLCEESVGNPLHLEHAVGHVSGCCRILGWNWHSRGDRRRVQRWALGLSTSGRQMLDGAAVAGEPFELELATAAADTSLAAATKAIDELLHFGLMAETDALRRFRFGQPLVCRAVYPAAPGCWRDQRNACPPPGALRWRGRSRRYRSPARNNGISQAVAARKRGAVGSQPTG